MIFSEPTHWLQPRSTWQGNTSLILGRLDCSPLNCLSTRKAQNESFVENVCTCSAITGSLWHSLRGFHRLFFICIRRPADSPGGKSEDSWANCLRSTVFSEFFVTSCGVPRCKYLVQRFQSGRLRVRSALSATFTPSTHAKKAVFVCLSTDVKQCPFTFTLTSLFFSFPNWGLRKF